MMGEKKTYKTSELIRRFLPYFKPYRATLFIDLFAAALTCVCDIVLPMFLRTLTNTALTDVSLITVNLLARLSIIYALLRVVDVCAQYYMSYQGHVMGIYIETDMRRSAYSHLMRLSHTYYSNTKVGQIMGRITNDLFEVTEFAHHCPEEFFIAGIKILVSFIILSRLNLLLTITVFIWVPLMGIICVKLNHKMRSTFAAQRVQVGELNANIEDSLLGQGVVKAFANESKEEAKFEGGNSTFFKIKEKSYRIMGMFNFTTRTFDGLMYLTVLIGGGIALMHGSITAGDMVAFVMYITTLLATIRRIIEFTEQFQRGITGIERFIEIMDQPVDIEDKENAIVMKDFSGDIEFKNVSFEYPDDHNTVFTNLNLHIKPGEKVALIGPSGGGKTTLCNLIPRFYDVCGGSVLLDGKDVRDYELFSLRRSVGIVQQDVYLFSGTVYDNIVYGDLNATKEEVIAAAKRAGAHEFITALKDGYDTYIGERGVKLSGGQKQRISIARVFLKNPPVILLDEATSALDNESEFAVAQSLEELAKDRTCLTIAHRLSTIKNSDRILVLTQEGITEEGTHEELMAKDSLYKHYYEMASSLK